MRNKLKLQILNLKKEKGFTLAEVLVATAVLVLFIVGALTLYINSHKTSVDQQQLAQMQHDARSAMFFISRDVRSAGVGLPIEYAGNFVEGMDGYGPEPIETDAIKIMGNFDEPMRLVIEDYHGASATAFLVDGSFQNQPYNCPDYYGDKLVFVFSTRCPGCVAIRFIPTNQVHGCQGGAEHVVLPPGQSELNPPGGLSEAGCDASCWIDAIITRGQVKQFWLDTTGNPNDYPDLNLVPGQKGYIGGEDGIGVLYLTQIDLNDPNGSMIHYPIAQNIENLQFQYNGDWNDDGVLDGFTDWQVTWTAEDIAKIRQVRMWILGVTENRFISVRAPQGHMFYNRPAIANSPSAITNDNRRRFLLETTINIRNLSLDVYNQQS